jgi:hypothetical protein
MNNITREIILRLFLYAYTFLIVLDFDARSRSYCYLKSKNHLNNIVTDLINALLGSSSVNMNRGNSRKETVFSMRSASSKSTEL